MDIVRMRRDLAAPVPEPVWPEGFGPRAFSSEHAMAAHGALAAAYAGGADTIPTFDAWWSALRADPEYDSALVFLAARADGRIVGAAQCWTGSFVKDLGVAPGTRRRGLGQALLLTAFAAFRDRGAPHVDLKVRAGNAAAIALYERLGMRPAPL